VFANKELVESLAPPEHVRHRLGSALREVRLLRGLLRLSQLAEKYRDCDRNALPRVVEVNGAPR
jgi:hypothetical protein